MNRFKTMAIAAIVSWYAVSSPDTGAEQASDDAIPSTESRREQLEALSRAISKSTEAYAKTRVKFISGGSSGLGEPLKTYVQAIEDQLTEYLKQHIGDIPDQSFVAGLHIHLRINSDGSVSDAGVSNDGLAAAEAQRLSDLLMHSGPFGPFPTAVIDEGYVTIILDRVVNYQQ